MLKLRDRDAILTRDDLIFRVYGYIHPSGAYICDPEYASPKSLSQLILEQIEALTTHFITNFLRMKD